MDAIIHLTEAVQMLGNGDAATRMGALEAHGKAMIEAAETISSGLHDIADAIRETVD